jgi:hypothetical protein
LAAAATSLTVTSLRPFSGSTGMSTPRKKLLTDVSSDG